MKMEKDKNVKGLKRKMRKKLKNRSATGQKCKRDENAKGLKYERIKIQKDQNAKG